MKVLILSSTVRVGRRSHQLATALVNILSSREGVSPELIDLANYDLNNLEHLFKSDPEPSKLKTDIFHKFEKCDGYIFISPEYNGSYCGSLKNAVDHFPKSCYHRKPIGISTVSTGAMGGMRAALQMQLLILALKAYPMPEMLLCPNVSDKFDEGNLIDDSFKKRMEFFVDEYLWFAKKFMS